MKTVTVRELQKSIKEAVDSAQKDRVIVTRRGEPAAVLVGVEGKDWETVVLETSAALWNLIEERRRESTLSAEELERHFSSSASPAFSRKIPADAEGLSAPPFANQDDPQNSSRKAPAGTKLAGLAPRRTDLQA